MTPEEVEEAMRRVARGAPAGITDPEIEASLRSLAADGMLEIEETPAGPTFRMTAAGAAEAERLMADVLDSPPPRRDALLHLMAVAEADYPGIDREALDGAAEVILHIEHHRLADLLTQMHNSGWVADVEWLADCLRQGLL